MHRMAGNTRDGIGTGLLLLALTGAAGGAWASGTLLREHLGGWGPASASSAASTTWCGASATADGTCADVLSSSWAAGEVTIAGRQIEVPAAFLGLAYFGSAGLWLLLLGKQALTPRTWARVATLVATTAGLLASLGFVGVMLLLGQWCALCGTAHAANFVLVAATWKLAQRRAPAATTRVRVERRPEDTPRFPLPVQPRLVFATVTALGVAVAGLWFVYDGQREVRRQWHKAAALRQTLTVVQSDEALLLREFFAQPVHAGLTGLADVDATSRRERLDVLDSTLLAPDLAAAQGVARASRPCVHPRDAGATNSSRPETKPSVSSAMDSMPLAEAEPTVVIFTDLLCKACGCFDAKWRARLEPLLGSRVRVEYRHFVSPAEGAAAGKASERRWEPAGAVEAARLVGGDVVAARLRELLFAQRPSWPELDYGELAGRIGLNVDLFLAEFRGPRPCRIVETNARLARQLDVREVPAVFVDGRRVPQICLDSPVFWSALAETLNVEEAAVTWSSADGP